MESCAFTRVDFLSCVLRCDWVSLNLCVVADRPWLTDTHNIQRLQEKVYVALQHCLQREASAEEKLAKVKERGSIWELPSGSLHRRMSRAVLVKRIYIVNNWP